MEDRQGIMLSVGVRTETHATQNAEPHGVSDRVSGEWKMHFA